MKLCFRISPVSWLLVCCECCVFSGGGLSDELMTHSEDSYRLWLVVVCDLNTTKIRKPCPTLGRSAIGKKILICCAVSLLICSHSILLSYSRYYNKITSGTYAQKFLIPLIFSANLPIQNFRKVHHVILDRICFSQSVQILLLNEK